MLDELKEYSEIKSEDVFEKINRLFEDLKINSEKLDMISSNIKDLESEMNNVEKLEELYGNEFQLCMQNVHIYEDLNNSLQQYTPSQETIFQIARIKRDSAKLLKVEIVEL